MSKNYYSLGLMSGTSMDGVDASIIQTNGKSKYKAILDKYFEYPKDIYQDLTKLRDKIKKRKDLKKFKSLGSSNLETEVPNLVQVLHNSFDWFTTRGIEELLKEVSPVEDFSGGRFELKFLDHEIKKPLEYW